MGKNGKDELSAGVWLARGARHAEALVLAAVGEHAAAVREDPRLLASPLRIVVPSRSLREHLAASIVRALGHAAAGVVIQTLRNLAHEVLRRAAS